MNTSHQARIAGPLFLCRMAVLAVVAVVSTGAICILRPSQLDDAYVTSGSMANTFWGRSFLVNCGDCGFVFRCDAEKSEFVPSDFRAVCPNCGHGDNSLNLAKRDEYGQSVKYDSSRLNHGREPKRWDVIAFHAPKDSSSARIKRIVGMPNEWIEVRHGDVYVNGELLRKPLTTQRELAVLVHDAGFRSRRRPQWNPWQSISDASGWTKSATGFVFHPTLQENDPSEIIDWLEYRNRPTEPIARGVRRPAEAPINDNSGYNQGISRDLNDVSDVMLSFWVRLSGVGEFAFAADDGGNPVEVVISTRDERMVVRVGGQVIQRTRIPSLLAHTRKLELSLIDQQVLLAIDGRTLIRFQLPRGRRHTPSSRPFRIGARNLQAWVSQLRVYRDIYYLNDRGLALPWRVERRLDADEFFLLGDNPPISHDSRQWSSPGVARKLLIGKVLGASASN